MAPYSYSQIYPDLYNKSNQKISTGNTDDVHKYMDVTRTSGIGYNLLQNLRYNLYKNRIYDSRLKNNPFTKEHLEQYKKDNSSDEIFNTYNYDDIIKFMNDIAQINYKGSTNISYARAGIKLKPRKWKSLQH